MFIDLIEASFIVLMYFYVVPRKIWRNIHQTTASGGKYPAAASVRTVKDLPPRSD